jgi:hypothetical protein
MYMGRTPATSPPQPTQPQVAAAPPMMHATVPETTAASPMTQPSTSPVPDTSPQSQSSPLAEKIYVIDRSKLVNSYPKAVRLAKEAKLLKESIEDSVKEATRQYNQIKAQSTYSQEQLQKLQSESKHVSWQNERIRRRQIQRGQI